MTNRFEDAQVAVQKARQALRLNRRTEARQWAEHAASLAPQMEDPWLILAAVASPRASVEYIQKALKINPNSPRAHKGMEWALQRLRESPPQQPAVRSFVPPSGGNGPGTPASIRRSPWFPLLLLGLGVLVCAVAAWSASASPAVASILNNSVPTPTHPQMWAQVEIPKPTYTPTDLPLAGELPANETPQPTLAPTLAPTEMPAEFPTDTPQPSPTEPGLPSPEPTWSGSLSMDIIPDTPTSVAPTPQGPAADSQTSYVPSGGEHWIDVNLTQQMVYAYEGDTVVQSFLVSTGTWQYPTVTGRYHIYVKLLYTDMAGPGYYLPNVPNTMYFYKGYALHGTYWHHNFGTPMSHGCVNLSIPDSQWLFNWASVGTLVNVHY